ncbi:DoxX family protein [Phycicoccus duodecadis]|uniref:Putative membrane protein YphA (DoxX/SURF4 family) n=1 Tax=Phycicoccus duodecadis TaxID=173053 RepID=A0A2N3YGU6_9MICO|nr:DoxX family protein [Phycicoccus duodecadis]PKW26085.1 putative membrane protein YphA (DoxX/SURF4 family) [Phycicoccus duodecadis]
MSLVRRVARPLLASMFVVGGVDQLKHPSAKAETARPIVEKMAPLLRLPQDTELLVRANGVAMVTAGTLLAMGRMPRLSATVLAATLVPTTVSAHQFWKEEDPAVRAQQRVHLLKNLGLLGGLLLAAVDTDGKPGLAYRAHLAGASVQRAARTTRREARHVAHSATTEARLKAAQAQHAFS